MGCAYSNPDQDVSSKPKEPMLVSETRDIPPDLLLKAITVGETGIGKTALIRALAGEKWDPPITTIGVDFITLCYYCMEQNVQVGGCEQCKTMSNHPRPQQMRIMIFDTAGQERFRSVTRSYYRDADLVLLCFKLGDEISLSRLNFWYDEIRQLPTGARKEKITYIVIGLQEDLLLDSKSPFQGPFNEGSLASLPYYHVSSKRQQSLEGVKNFLCLACRTEKLRHSQAKKEAQA